MFGTALTRPGARPRPHRLPADARREPARVERQPDDGARRAAAGCARSARAAARSSWSTRAARAPPTRPTSTTSSGPAPTRLPARARPRALRRGARRARARSPSTSTASTSVERSPRRFTPEAVAPGLRHRRRGRSGASRASSRPPSRAAVYGRIGTCTQEFGTLASWLVDVAQRAHRQPRPPGRRDVHRAPRPARANTAGGRARAAACAFGRWHEPRARAARGLRRAAGRRASPRRSRRRARARSARSSPSPATRSLLDARTAAGSSARSASLDFMVSRRHLPERDDAPRRRHPARASRRSSARTTTSRSTSSRSATSPTTRRRSFEPADDRPRDWEILLRLAGDRRRPGRRTPTSRRSTTSSLASAVAEAVGASGRRSPAATRTSSSRRSRRARARSGSSTSCCAPAPTATASAPSPTACTLDALERARTASTSARSSRASPRCCARRRARSSSRRRRSLADVARLRAALARPRTARLVLVGRRDLRSNNSWMHNIDVLVKGKDALHAAGASRRRRPARPRRRRARARALAGRRGRGAGRGDRRDHAGVVSIPHGWGHDAPGTRLDVAATTPGANSNLLADEVVVDPLSGNAVLNGIPVEVAPV